jgi:hypothetical protein
MPSILNLSDDGGSTAERGERKESHAARDEAGVRDEREATDV